MPTENQYDLDTVRHSAAHVLAMAALRLFPDAKIGLGPVTEDGFYYDFEFPYQISESEMRQIEAEMNMIIQNGADFNQIVVNKEEGFDILLRRGQIYKAELLREIPEPEASFYRTGDDFIDLCRGPHVANSRDIGVIKLTSLTNVHWQNDPTRPELQRIVGVAFHNVQDLQSYLHKQAAIHNLDFRNLAKSLQLTLGGEGKLIYTPGGTLALKQVQNLVVNKLTGQQFEEILCPPITEIQNAAAAIDDYYMAKNRSYKELPLRLFSNTHSELESPVRIVDRELSSVTTITAKSFFQPSEKTYDLHAHISGVVEILDELKVKYIAYIHTPGVDDELTIQASELLQRKGIPQTQLISPNVEGFNIVFMAQDHLEREWSLATISYRMLGQQYVSKQGEMSPVHTLTTEWLAEKVLAYFLEDQEGILPLWLAPTQITIIPISDEETEFAEKVEKLLEENNFRARVDARAETMQARIRSAELLKIPLILVVGEKESQNNAVSLRLRNQREVGLVSLDSLVETILGLST